MSICELAAPPDLDGIEGVEARDFLDHFLPLLDEPARRALTSWSEGQSTAAIARAEGISVRAAQLRIRRGLERLRELAGE